MHTTVSASARAELRGLTTPAALAYVLITLVALAASADAYALGLAAEVADRVALAGQLARDSAHPDRRTPAFATADPAPRGARP